MTLIANIKKIIYCVKFYDSLIAKSRTDDIDALGDKIIELKNKLAVLESKVGNPIEVVKKITNNEFKWYDYEKLNEQDLKAYHSEARSILKSKVFKNELAFLNTSFLEWAGKQSHNFDGVNAMRHQISGISLLKERFESIPDPARQLPSTENIHEAI